MRTTVKTSSTAHILQVLLDQEVLDAKRLRELRNRVSEPSVDEIINAGLVSDVDVARAFASHLSLPYLDTIPTESGTEEILHLLPEKLCRDQLVAPLRLSETAVDLVIVTPDGLLVIDEIQLLTGLRVRPLIAPLRQVEAWIERIFNERRSGTGFLPGAEEFEQIEDDPDDADGLEEEEVLHLDTPPPPGRNGRIIRLVNQILEQAIHTGASDIHLEPFEENCRIRLRIDGHLRELPPMPRSSFTMVISRFKILAKMDIAEKRIPQDGAIALRSGDRRIDLRVSTVPAVHGEKMVMRLLDRTNVPLDLLGLGFNERQARDLEEALRSPHGLMLVTGPTGSGKSTTLYAGLNLLNKIDVNISTVEDPVEYKFRGMNQVQVKPQIGLTFATALRAFLRQDPDIIMVGEVRDQETAEICMRAALTGHLVLSTLHTNDALSAVTRLVDMGIEPFLLSSTLRVLQAQRLVRRLCPHCRQPYHCEEELARRHGLEPGQLLYRPKGCAACHGLGYRGRVGVFEVIPITQTVGDLIQRRASLQELRQAARNAGMMFLLDGAIEKAKQGVTSLEYALSLAIGEGTND